jgi:hypothetical protein
MLASNLIANVVPTRGVRFFFLLSFPIFFIKLFYSVIFQSSFLYITYYS